MKIREWSGTRLVAVLGVGWAIVWVLAVIGHGTKNSVLAVLVIISALILSCVAAVWSWYYRIKVGNWHFGKFVMLWALLGAFALFLRGVEEGLEIVAFLVGGIPLVVLTWSWLSAREKQ